MRFYEITEARRNAKHPSQERLSPAQTVLKYKDAGDDYFITFTDLPKVGFNPTSPYSTPLGVYCYPITPFAKRLKEDDDIETFTSKFPFASDRTYFFILRAKKPMVVAQKYNQKMYDTDLQKLEEITNRDDLHFEPDDKTKHTPFGLIWENLFQVSHYYPKSQAMWNKLMRLLGWYGVVDYGSGYIHENEPTQAFFISPDAYEVVEKYEIHSRGHVPIYYQKMKMATPRDKKILIEFKNALKVSDINKISSLLINMSANIRPTAYQIILDVIIKENRPLLISTLPVAIFLKFLETYADFVETHLKELVKYSYTVDGKSKMDKIYDDIPRDVLVKWVNKYDFYFDGMLNHGGTSYFAKKYYDRILDDVKNPKNKTPWKNIDVLAKAKTTDFPIELASEQYKSLWPYLVKQFGQTDKKIPIDILLEVMYNDPNTTNLIDTTQIRIMTSDEKRKFATSYIDSVFRADEYEAGKFSYHAFPWFYFQDETISYVMNYLISKAKENLKNGKLTRNDVNMIKNDLEYIKQMLARIRMKT